MYAVIELECIGEDSHIFWRGLHAALSSAVAGGPVPRPSSGAMSTHMRRLGYMSDERPWVARITGTDPRYKLARTFLRGQRDYSRANGTGSRGIYLVFALKPGIYEVNERVSWKRTERYFLHVDENGNRGRITREEVDAWLSTVSA